MRASSLVSLFAFVCALLNKQTEYTTDRLGELTSEPANHRKKELALY